MEVLPWLQEHWFDLFEAIGIVGGLIFTAFTIRNDEKARKISNLIAINENYGRIWQALYNHPELSRILQKDVDILRKPVTDQEWLFVKMLILHLDAVFRAMKSGMYVKLHGLQKDIREFFALPIPRAVWEKMKPFQEDKLVRLVETALADE